MNLAQLRAFNAVAAHGSFSAAAQSLGITQPAVTQHIRALEDALGARLFHRRGGMIELTSDARDLLPTVRQVVLSVEDIGKRIDHGRGLRAGYLSLGLCAPHVAMPIIARFRTDFPGIRLETRLSNSASLLEQIAQHQLDIAVATLDAPRADLFCEKLTEQRVLILVPAGHPLSAKKRIKPAALKGQNFVLRESGSMTRHLLERALAAEKISLGETLVLSSREAVKEAVAAGIGFGIVLDKELGRDPRIVGIELDAANCSAGEYLVAQHDFVQLGALRSFITSAHACYPRPKAKERAEAG
jgi:LysR family transcriptional regulator, low CO2-responsive transcriptional regulator